VENHEELEVHEENPGSRFKTFLPFATVCRHLRLTQPWQILMVPYAADPGDDTYQLIIVVMNNINAITTESRKTPRNLKAVDVEYQISVPSVTPWFNIVMGKETRWRFLHKQINGKGV
jgi:hypothetical protein